MWAGGIAAESLIGGQLAATWAGEMCKGSVPKPARHPEVFAHNLSRILLTHCLKGGEGAWCLSSIDQLKHATMHIQRRRLDTVCMVECGDSWCWMQDFE